MFTSKIIQQMKLKVNKGGNMISSEKELEDYICDNQEEFINVLKKIYAVKNIEFIGRQIKIGKEKFGSVPHEK